MRIRFQVNCKSCRYPLLNLDTHRCPECGTAFDPVDPSTYVDSSTTRENSNAAEVRLVMNIIHGIVSAVLAFIAYQVPLTWVAFDVEYGPRGSNGEYLRDLNDPGTIWPLLLSGAVLAAGIMICYWFVVVAVRRSRERTSDTDTG